MDNFFSINIFCEPIEPVPENRACSCSPGKIPLLNP